jgi:hypothetical protein
VTIPCGCKLIGNRAFWGSGLKEAVIPGSCRVGEYAFSGCDEFTKVTFGPGCTSIGWFAFNGCSHLASVRLPSTVQWIGDCGFGGCTSLATIAIPKGCQLEPYAFYGCRPIVKMLNRR